jgi:light-harvesting complex I chlorophyll a/b binding protein 5
LVAAGTLLFTQAILFHWVETKRGMDLKNPGSQGDGSFFGITEEFKGKENAYPGEQRHAAAGGG